MRKALEGEGDSMSARESEGVFDITHRGQTRERKLTDDQKPCRGHTHTRLHCKELGKQIA